MADFTSLPIELRTVELVKSLSVPDLLQYGCVNKRLHRFASDPKTWSYLLHRDFGLCYEGPHARQIWFTMLRGQPKLSTLTFQKMIVPLLHELNLLVELFTFREQLDYHLHADEVAYQITLKDRPDLGLSIKSLHSPRNIDNLNSHAVIILNHARFTIIVYDCKFHLIACLSYVTSLIKSFYECSAEQLLKISETEVIELSQPLISALKFTFVSREMEGDTAWSYWYRPANPYVEDVKIRFNN
jgi:hypothetical protein